MSTTTRAKYMALGGAISLSVAWPLPIQAADTTVPVSNPVILAQAGSGDEPHPRAKQNQKAQEEKKKQQQQRKQEQRSERKEKREQKKDDHAERKRERRDDRKENKERKRDQKAERKEDRAQHKEERREDRKDNREQKRENKAERKEDRAQRQEERRDDRQDNREQKRENKAERKEDRAQRKEERRDDRQENRERNRADRKDDRRDERREKREQRRAGPSEGRKGREGNISEIRRQRKERREGGRVVIEEPGNRRIIREGRRTIIRHDDADRFRRNARNVDVRRRNGERITTITRPNGVTIITIEDENGRLLRRVRRGRDGREVVLIDNRRHHRHGPDRRGDNVLWFLLDLTMPRVNIERRYYVVDADRASEDDLYDTLIAPPVVDIEREYSLDEVRYNYPLRARMRSVNLNTVNFEFGSWELDNEALDHLEEVARAINRALDRNPNEIFLIEGHTDAVGEDEDNLTLSDRRAESVAIVLSEDFGIPPENLTTQGYGEEYLLVETPEPERRNRRVTIRRITPLLSRNR
ncbi:MULTISPECIES: OmpA family protein [Filomicrobium]|uniref:Outer membrane protein OmpA n=1 Tax=Filomicrobium insigne TaxID=418854 RepID=A0A1H0PVF9_9HYPH|nr:MULTISPECIES: OmpA family protein [Filomicrobium]SDP09083.1 Outer membrane protein OmpA [Filomicrobium insigne]